MSIISKAPSQTRQFSRLLTVATVLALAACASVPLDYPREPSYALTDTVKVEHINEGIDVVLPEIRHEAAEIVDGHKEHIQAREEQMRSIWAGVELRNDRMRAVTGVDFRPFETSLRDCVESLISIGEVEPRRRSE